MRAEPLRSPCLACERLGEEKNDCIKDCAALLAFHGLAPAPEKPGMARLSVAEAEKALGAEKVKEILASPGEAAADEVEKFCPKHPGRPVHKKANVCLECCQERGRINALSRKKRPILVETAESAPVLALDPGPGRPVKLVSMPELLLAKFPAFDNSWTRELQLKWFEAFDKLLALWP